MNRQEIPFENIRVGDDAELHDYAVNQYSGKVTKVEPGYVYIKWVWFAGTYNENRHDDSYGKGSFDRRKGNIICYRNKKPLIIINK